MSTPEATVVYNNCLITFTHTKAKRFLEIYTESLNHGNEVFNFEGIEFLITCAKYLIEYMVNEGFLPKNSQPKEN